MRPAPPPAPQGPGLTVYGDSGTVSARCDDVWKSIEWGSPVVAPPMKFIDDGSGELMISAASYLAVPAEHSGYVAWESSPLVSSDVVMPGRAMSHSSFDTPDPSSAGSTLSTMSSLHTDLRDTVEPVNSWSPCTTPLDPKTHEIIDLSLICLGPRCGMIFASADQLDAHVKARHAFTCAWSGCDRPSFASSESLVWHIKAEHLLICPVSGCMEKVFDGIRGVTSHVAVAHPEVGREEVKEWQLSPPAVGASAASMRRTLSRSQQLDDDVGGMVRPVPVARVEDESALKESSSVAISKRKCQDQLRSVVEKKARKTVGTPRTADSPTDLVRSRASRRIETTSFPLVFEHAILPFLAEYMPKWSDTRHVISVTRGKTPQSRRICIMTRKRISLARKIIIANHVKDLLPDKFVIEAAQVDDLPLDKLRCSVSFVFSTGQVGRITWARGLGKDHMDEICAPRNPYHFPLPCMGDSIGIRGAGGFEDSTATLGPCLSVDGGSFWLGNFHPFLEAYGQVKAIQVEHPSPEDRTRCLEDGHDAMSKDDNFKLGRLEVTSGLNLKTTRLSHDPYWSDCCQELPFVVTDWALIASRTARPNMLRRFPSETQAPIKERLVTSIIPGVPAGAYVVSSGRTSGYQRGQICEIPAYVSGDENGTQKATREWFVEEPYASDDEEGWIRGGIGVEGDSGAAVVDAETGSLVGQLWGRNRYWGPGPRHTFFTPMADIFDDIQEKCGLRSRPSLPQHGGDDADRYPVFPSCRQCYDLRTYLDSRRSSRMSLQSMYMGRGPAGDGDQDLASLEAVSELATPLDYPRSQYVEEAGASFNNILSPVPMNRLFPGAPLIADGRSPYAMTISVEDLYDVALPPPTPSKKRTASASWTGLPMFEADLSAESSKKQRTAG